METYFTSDTHFWHKNILDFENRPYQSVEEMTVNMIDKWNSQVNEDDVVYHLGDLCLGSFEQTVDVLKQLKGKILLIKGNHDFSKHYKKINQMGLLHEYHEVGITLKHQKQQMWLTHYPFEIGLRPRKWSIHGHIHGDESMFDNQINVGIDSPHFKNKPFGELITIDELYKLMMDRLPAIEEKYINQKQNKTK
ncbi:metallophosphoesterase family protein [Bacillus cereus group sp. MG16]|uniref:metallophosphoesterase family protein n=1 Tax=Bacillus cereus group sp. MG16 TaxID=3040249 RepID=UPI00339AD8DE